MQPFPTTYRHLVPIVAFGLVLSACGTSGDASSEPITTTGPAPTSSAIPQTTTTSTTPPTTTTTTTTEPPCEVKCPIDDSEQTLIQSSVDAYSSHDWDTWLATVTDEEPTFATPVGQQTPALVEFDFIWSAAMNDIWTLGECLSIREVIRCEVSIEDDLHRAVGVLPSECSIDVSIEGDLVDWRRYELHPCHLDYDVAMHDYGQWFLGAHPELETIWGFHYRGWNQPDITAGARAAEFLAEYIAATTTDT